MYYKLSLLSYQTNQWDIWYTQAYDFTETKHENA